MKKSNVKMQELGSKEILTRAEMRNVKGGTVHICTAICNIEMQGGSQTGYITVPDCLHNPASACDAVEGAYQGCVCH